MGQRTHYWGNSKFADWIRGTEKPSAATWPEWRVWKKTVSQSNPIRYWIAEEGLDYVQNFIWWPVDKLYDIKYYINNRWVTRTHALTAHPRDIPRGQWRDVGNRFLPCLFNELVDYVEVELAWWNIAWDKEARKKFKPPFYAAGWFRWRTWRCPESGLDNIEWQRNLRWTEEEVGADDPRLGQLTHQAAAAQEILDLYNWWTKVYPNRPDPHDASGWTAMCDKNREEGWNIFDRVDQTEEEHKETHRILDLCHKIEQEYKDEDTEMLIRLIKIRDSLWT